MTENKPNNTRSTSELEANSDIIPSESCGFSKTDVNVDAKPDINLDGKLNPSDYVTSVPISQKTANELSNSLAKQRETFRSKLAMRLTKIFGFSLGASFLLILITSVYPAARKGEIKDLISATITPQVTLLSFALGFYFGNSKEH